MIPILAYHLSYMKIEDGSASKPTFIMDANTGAIIHSWEGLKSGNPNWVEGTGPFEFHAIGGNPKMEKLRYGEDLPALYIWMEDGICYLHNEKVTGIDGSPFDYGDDIDFSVGFSFACEQGFNDSINGAYSPLADEFFFGSIVHDVFYEWLGIPPLVFKVVMVVHFGNMIENTFSDGHVLLFGDGGSRSYPFRCSGYCSSWKGPWLHWTKFRCDL